MTLLPARLSVWFKSQLQQKQSQWLQTRKLNLFNLFGFSRPEPLKVFNKTGRAVILNTTSLEDDEDGATLNVDLSIENDFAPSYSPTTDVIIRNYSSSLTYSEIESMITMQKHATKCDNNKCVIGHTFAGIIESIPDKILSNEKHSFPFEIGDRVWGISSSTFGHCWSDYIHVSYKTIYHAPINIPLHFCGLYPLQLYNLHTLLNYAKININDLKNKRVLFIGTGRRSMINIFVPFLKHLDENNHITIIEDKKHCRLNKNIINNYLKIDAFHTFDECMDDLTDLDELDASFDIVFDSMAMDKTEIMDNCKFVKAKGVYFWRQNHMAQFDDNIDLGKWRIALKGAKFLQECDRDIKKQFDGIKFVPDMRPNLKLKENNILDSFTSYLTEMSFPIIIDKMYNLNDIQSAFNYAFNNDDNILGENIGILIQKEDGFQDDIFFEESFRPKTIKLPTIDSLYKKNQNNNNKIGNNNNNNNMEPCIEDIIEHETSSSSNLGTNDYGFVQDKTEILESQTIAKNTSNKY